VSHEKGKKATTQGKCNATSEEEDIVHLPRAKQLPLRNGDRGWDIFPSPIYLTTMK